MCADPPSPPEARGDPAGLRRPDRRVISVRQRLRQEQRLESVAILASGITHDLNNVFAPIIISAELLRKNMPEPEAQHCLNILLRSAWKGSETLKKILIFAGGMEGKLIELQLGAAIEELVESIRQTLPPGITLEAEISQDLWPVSCDFAQLERAIVNLGLNGVEAMPQGGRLLLRAQNTLATAAMVRGYSGSRIGPHILVTLADTGHGIPPKMIDRIFDPFFTTRGFDLGRGLGLSVVYGIVRRHAGFIQVHSEVGCGTEFEIFLPAVVR